ncbi:MAG TPA: DUF4410 domain-containing protein [Candidatus Binatia bacterium]|nr:DUF4410 domain-containing protein [Candidatus Binatia bacterium]
MNKVNRTRWNLTAAVLVVSLCGCAKTVVQPKYEQRAAAEPSPRPGRVFVYDFAVTAAEVSENRGPLVSLVNALGDKTENERELAIAQEVQNRMAEDLVAGIQELGLPAQRAPRGTPLPPDGLAVAGVFLNVDEGNRLRRAVVGFGAGQSQVSTQVQVYAPSTSGLVTLLEFSTSADSGSAPGALVLGGAGAAAQGGMTAGVVAANVGMGAAKGHRSQVEQMTARSAAQAVAYLSQYFAKQGWIPAEKARQTKLANE